MKPVEIEFLIKGKGGLADAGASLDNLRGKLVALIKESEAAKKKLSEAGNTDDFDGAIAAAEEYREALRKIQAAASAVFSEQKTQLVVLKQALADIDKKKTQAGIDGDTKAVEELEKRYQELKKQIADAEAALRIYSRANFEATEGIGRTQEAIDRCKDKMAQLQNESQKTKAGTDDLGNSFKGSKQKADEYSGSLDDVIGHAKDIPGPVGDAATSIGHLTKATLRFLATPIGAVLAAISAALAMVASWFKRTEEGQNALAVGSAYFTQVLGSLLDVVDNVGEWLYKAFTKPKSAIKDLADFARDQLLNRLKAIGEVAKGVLDMLSGDISGGYKRVMNGWIQGVTGIKDVSGKVGGWMAETNKKANERMAITRRQNELDRQERDNLVERAKAEAEINKLREKAYDQTLSAKERSKALNDASEKTKAMYEKEIALAKEHYAVIKDTNALSHSNKEDKKKEAEAEARIYQLQAQRESALTSLRRQSNRTESSGASASKQMAELAAKQIEEERRWQDEITKARQAALDARRDAEIAAIQNDGERERAEQDEQHVRRLRQIKEQADDMKRAVYEHNKKIWEDTHKGSPYELTEEGKKGLDGIQLSAVQSETISAQLDKENAEYHRLILQRYRDEVQAMRDYLKEYGSLQQHREAITREYDQKIEDESNAIQKAALQKQKEDALAALDFREIQQSINWEYVFNDLDKLSKEALTDLKKKLRAALDMKDITPENAKVLSEKILEVENRITDNMWTSMIPALKERQRLINEVRSSEEEISRLQKNVTSASVTQVSAQSNLQGLAEQYVGRSLTKEELNAESGDALIANLNEWIEKQNESSDGFGKKLLLAGASADKMKEAFNKNVVASTNLMKAQDDLAAAQKRGDYVNNILKNLTGKGGDKQGFGSAVSSIFNTAAEAGGGGFMGFASIIQNNMNSLADFTDKIGLAGTDFGNAVHGFADGVNGFMGAIQSLASGDIFGAVNGVIDGFAGLYSGFESLGLSLGIFGGSDNHEEMLEIQNDANDKLDIISERVKDISDKLSESYGANAIGTYEQLTEFLRQSQTQYNRGLQAAGWDRYGGGGSEWYHRNKNGGEGQGGFVDRIKKEYGLDFRGTAWQDLFNYLAELEDGRGAEILHDMRTNPNLVDAWEELMRTNSYDEGAIAEWVKRWSDSFEEINAAKQSLYERITTTTEDDVFSDFLDSLYDLAAGSGDVMDDIAENWQEMVNKMAINNLVGVNFQQRLKEWYEELAKVNRKRLDKEIDDITYKAELDSLKKGYQDAVTDAQAEIEQFRSMGIIKATESGSGQSAKVGGFTAMSQDQGTKLDGMFTSGLQHWSSMDRELGNVSDRLGSALDRLKKIEENTSYCKRLDDIADDIKSIKNNGIKVK